MELSAEESFSTARNAEPSWGENQAFFPGSEIPLLSLRDRECCLCCMANSSSLRNEPSSRRTRFPKGPKRLRPTVTDIRLIDPPVQIACNVIRVFGNRGGALLHSLDEMSAEVFQLDLGQSLKTVRFWPSGKNEQEKACKSIMVESRPPRKEGSIPGKGTSVERI